MTATIATLRRLSPQVWVTGQLLPGQMAELGAAGFTCLMNHRPDHEEPGQPLASEIAGAGAEAGLFPLIAANLRQGSRREPPGAESPHPGANDRAGLSGQRCRSDGRGIDD